MPTQFGRTIGRRILSIECLYYTSLVFVLFFLTLIFPLSFCVILFGPGLLGWSVLFYELLMVVYLIGLIHARPLCALCCAAALCTYCRDCSSNLLFCGSSHSTERVDDLTMAEIWKKENKLSVPWNKFTIYIQLRHSYITSDNIKGKRPAA